MIRQSGSIALSTPSDCLRFVTTKINIQIPFMPKQKGASVRKLSMELDISDKNIRRIIKKNDLVLRVYKRIRDQTIAFR